MCFFGGVKEERRRCSGCQGIYIPGKMGCRFRIDCWSREMWLVRNGIYICNCQWGCHIHSSRLSTYQLFPHMSSTSQRTPNIIPPHYAPLHNNSTSPDSSQHIYVQTALMDFHKICSSSRCQHRFYKKRHIRSMYQSVLCFGHRSGGKNLDHRKCNLFPEGLCMISKFHGMVHMFLLRFRFKYKNNNHMD